MLDTMIAAANMATAQDTHSPVSVIGNAILVVTAVTILWTFVLKVGRPLCVS